MSVASRAAATASRTRRELRLVALERRLELAADGDERPVGRQLDGKGAHAVAVMRERRAACRRQRGDDRLRTGRRVAVEVAADPRAERQRRRRVREAEAPVGVQLLRGGEEAVLEE